MNFDYLGKYEEMINYTHTKIFSVDANNEQELSYIMKCLYEKMKNNNMIKQILYSRRRKHVGDKKCIFFLIKIFIDIKCENTIIKKEILTPTVLIDKNIKIKINDIEIDKNNKHEQGVKKNNWANF